MRSKVARKIREIVGYSVGSSNGLARIKVKSRTGRQPLMGINADRHKYQLVKKHYSIKKVHNKEV